MSTTYQSYDFVRDIDLHIRKNVPIDLKKKSEAFKNLFFKLKHFHIQDKIKQTHPLFNEFYFMYTLYGIVYVAKRLETSPNSPLKFESVEILNGVKIIRKLKLDSLFDI